MKFVVPKPFSDPVAAARKLLGIEPIQDGRIHIEQINAPFLKGRRQPGRVPCRSELR